MPAPFPDESIILPLLVSLWITRSKSSCDAGGAIFTSMRLPAAVQSATVPVTVSVKVSQETPSTQVLSPLAAPVPVAVPIHAKAGPPVPILPEAGVAEGDRLLKIARTIRARALIKNRVPAVTRAMGEIAFFFIGTRGGC